MGDILSRTRTWVTENYRNAEHLLQAEEWLRRIDPTATQEMLLATLTHDMERAFPGPDSPRQNPDLGPDDPIYNQAHSERSARIVSAYLRKQSVPEEDITQVAKLIRAHEVGGWPEANQVQAADSLSFLEVNVDLFLKRIGPAGHGMSAQQVRAKFDWMYHRIQIVQAQNLARPLYDLAIRKLNARDIQPSTRDTLPPLSN